MPQGKLVRILGYYIDASYIEGIISTFRKLLIDIHWIYGRRLNNSGLYEIHVLVNDHPNLKFAILDLSKTVGIEKVEIYDKYEEREIVIDNSTTFPYGDECKNSFILHIPIYSGTSTYKRGELYGENISRSRCISRYNKE